MGLEECERELIQAAVAWWKSHRPIIFNEGDHLNVPAINCSPLHHEVRLATKVATYIKSKNTQKKGKRRGKKT